MKSKSLVTNFKTVEEKQEYQRLILEIKGELPTKKANHEVVIMALECYKHFLKEPVETHKHNYCLPVED